MNRKSLQFRLTLWYAVSLTITLIVVFASVYLVTKRILLSQTDTTLAAHGNQIIAAFSIPDSDMHQLMTRQTFLTQLEESPGMLIVIMDENGNILTSSQKITQHESDLKAIFSAAQYSQTPFFMNQTVATIPMRFWVKPVQEDGKLSAVVLMGHPTEVIQKSLRQLLTTLGIIFTIFLIPTIIGGYLHAKAALAPISIISEKLKKISHENLNERITVPDTEDQIAELGTTFNNLLDRLHGAFKRERQFIADVAHELKTPLAILQTNSDVTLSKKRTNKEYQLALQETQTDAKRITRTVGNILDLAWSEADQASILEDQVHLSDLLSELKEITTKLASAKSIQVQGTIERDVVVAGKEDKLSRAILNILDNAIKYTPAKGTISLSLHKRNSDAVIGIKDTGVGIAEKDIAHIFDRFYRGSKTNKSFGSGLGLAIASATIKAHRGAIGVKSLPGKGTTFTITLPLMKTSS